MENIYTAKAIKTLKGLKKNGYTANLYCGSKKVGYASKLPDDGYFTFSVDDEENGLFASIPEEDRFKPFFMESFITNIVNKTLTFKKVKSYRKNINLLVVIEHGCVCAIEYTGWVRTKTIEAYMKERPNAIILNRLSDDEIWEALDTYLAV